MKNIIVTVLSDDKVVVHRFLVKDAVDEHEAITHVLTSCKEGKNCILEYDLIELSFSACEYKELQDQNVIQFF
jgi:hypothetical protein